MQRRSCTNTEHQVESLVSHYVCVEMQTFTFHGLSRSIQHAYMCTLMLLLNFSRRKRHKAGNTQLMFFLKFGGSFALPLPR